MYYHVKIELNEKNKKDYHTKLFELDKVDINEIIDEIVSPYLKEEEFFFDGRMLTKLIIRSLKIYKTQELSQTLVDIEDNRNRNNQFFFSSNKNTVITCDRYSEDITKEIFKNILKSTVKKSTEKNDKDKNKIFIVHGHDNEAKLEIARFIEKIGFEPIILHEQASNSQTIIEKIESYSDVGFGIVLYTGCDVGAKKSDHQHLNKRARQNVVFEHGFLIGKLSRSNVCSLVKGDIETPNILPQIIKTTF